MDCGDGVEIEVFDEPDVAAAKHRSGLRRLVALQIKEPLKYLEKNIPELQKMATAYMGLGTLEELREQIIVLALDRAFLAEPLPADEAGFMRRIDEGRSRLTLIAQEVARLAGQLLAEYATAQRKLKDSRPPKDVADDIQAQLQRLMPKRFMLAAPYAQLQHMVRYLKAVTLRLDKLKADPARDAARLAELRPLEQRWLRRIGRAEGQRRCAARRIPLAAGGTACQLLRAGTAHAAAGQRQAARQGLGSAVELSPAQSGRHRRQPRQRHRQFGLVVLLIDQLAGVEGAVRAHVEVAVAAQVEQDHFRPPSALQRSASTIAPFTAWLASGAGTMPSARANITPASKQAFWW